MGRHLNMQRGQQPTTRERTARDNVSGLRKRESDALPRTPCNYIRQLKIDGIKKWLKRIEGERKRKRTSERMNRVTRGDWLMTDNEQVG